MAGNVVSERRRQQNREAQRTYRKGLLKRIEDLENQRSASPAGSGGSDTTKPTPTSTNNHKTQPDHQTLAPSDDEAFSFQSSPLSRALSLDPIIESTLNPRRGFMDPLSGYPTFDHDDNSANTDSQTGISLSCWLKSQEANEPIFGNQSTMGGVGGTVLHAAVVHGNEAIVKLLIEKGGDLNALTQQRKDTLHLAVESNQMNIVRLVLKAGANVNSVDGCGHSALFKAILGGNEDLVRLLLDYGADVNQSIALVPEASRIGVTSVAAGFV
ncbi:ankyrin repeat-containing domain protein [Colletotrichum phormii]|uniref:Ankyrin repeat-containing domain protein n=1 Tax=Colletotrichum phormii TaxID=359342 RepID=A0AAJ0ED74_9PEZI|nr:ankyrin repeat-containing domain protein [Colletotrichum phormii]KAK1635572.1 ankyrin repeat-containing domain protein [Colletotrichum phormii]